MSDTVLVNLPSGLIRAIYRNGITIARGVKYAMATRFQPPQLYTESWKDTVDCTQPATICPQIPSRLDYFMGPTSLGRVHDEDCLHVSVFSPGKEGNSLPVMVFIHGGAYLSGGGDLDCYSSEALAGNGVVVVNVTYRLGIFGYQGIEGVAKPNLGLMDQIAALKWVQRNIGAFGGDKGQVSLFGESAGGDSIYCLLGAETEGLFHRVVFQSAPFGLRGQEKGDMVTAMAKKASEVGGLKEKTSEELLGVEMELLGVAMGFMSSGMPYGPQIGYEPLPEAEEFEKRVSERVKGMSVIVGYTKDDGVPFADVVPKQLLHGMEAGEYATKKWFQEPADEFIQRAKRDGAKVSKYKWDVAFEVGAVHTIELAFLLGNWEAWKDGEMVKGGQEVLKKVGSEARKLWADFGKGEDVGDVVVGEDFQYK